MLQTRVMPCLLLKDEALVKTIRFKNPSYVGDPINAVRIYNEKEVDELIFLDITATRENKKIPFELIEQIATECFMPVAYGGGIRRLEDARTIFNLGVEKIVLNTCAVENSSFVREAAAQFGSQSIMVSVDVKKNWRGQYRVCAISGTKITSFHPVEFAKQMEVLGVGELLVHSIDRDGTMEGYDLVLIQQVSQAVSIPIIACGGAGSVEDFGKAVKEGGASAVAAGSLVVYQGKNRAVLINFPAPAELEGILEDRK